MKTRVTALFALAACFAGGTVAWADKPEQKLFDPIEVTGEILLDCGDFLVKADYRVEGFVRFYYRKDGSLSRLFMHLNLPYSIYYNADHPSYWLPGKAEGQRSWDDFDETGNWIGQTRTGATIRVIAPGYGPVFIDVGRWVYDATLDEFTFMAGKHDWFGEQVQSDAICAALRP